MKSSLIPSRLILLNYFLFKQSDHPGLICKVKSQACSTSLVLSKRTLSKMKIKTWLSLILLKNNKKQETRCKLKITTFTLVLLRLIHLFFPTCIKMFAILFRQ